MASTIGTRVAFHSTAVGKGFLSAMSVAKANDLISRINLPAFTQFTTTDRETLRAIVRQADQDGYVCDDQENEIGIVCFGAAIRDSVDNPVASVSVSVPLFRLDDARRYSAPLLEAVAAISKRMGYIGAV